jgi:PAS domain S-box-containing protein
MVGKQLCRRFWLPVLVVLATQFMWALPAPAAPEQGDRVVVQLRWLHQFQFAGYYAALENGYYREAGLDVTLVEGGPKRDAIEEVLSGRAQYGAASNELLLTRLRGKPVKVLAVIFQQSPSIFLARKISGISSPQDMLGQRVMMMPGMGDAELLAMFMKEGVKLDKIHRLPTSFNIEDLLNGKTDVFNAYLTNEPYYLEQRGMPAAIIRPSTYGIHFYGDCVFTSEEEVKKNPERVKAFRAATLRGWQYAMDHPEEVIELILTKYPTQKTRDHLRYEATAMRELLQPEMIEMGHMNAGRWRHMAETFAELGLVDKNFKLDGLTYDPSQERDLTPLWWVAGVASGILLVVGLVAAALVKFNLRLRREVEERARAEERFANMAANVPGAIIQLLRKADGSRRYTYLSARAKEFFGVEPEVVIDEGRMLNWHPDDRERIDRQIAANNAVGAAHNLVGRIVLPDGQMKWVNLSASPAPLPGGDVQLDGFILDVTERKLAEMEYLASEHKIKAMSQAVDDALIMLDSQGKVLFWNPAAEKLFGYTASEALGLDFHSMAAPEQFREKARLGLKEFARGGQGRILGVTTEIEARDRAGRLFPVEVSISSFQVDDEWFSVGTVRDISARKRAEEALQQERKRLQGIMDTSPVGVGISRDGVICFANPRYTELVRARVGDAAAQIYVHPQDRERMVQALSQADVVPEMSVQMYGPNGEIRDILATFMRTEYEGKPGVLGWLVDVTELKRTEEAAKESERRLGDIIDFLPDPTQVIDTHGTVLAWNRAMESLSGVSKADMLGKDDYENAIPFYGERRPILANLAMDWDEEMAGRYLQIRKEGEQLVSESFHADLGEGGVYLASTASVLRDATGQVVGAIQTSRDITARRQMEEKLREREAFFRAVFDNAGVGIVDIGREGLYLRANQSFLQMLGYTWDELEGMGPVEVTHPEEREWTRQALSKLTSGESGVMRAEKRYQRKDGSEVWGDMVAVPILDQDGRFRSTVATITDITERKRAEALMVEKEVAEEAAARAEAAMREALAAKQWAEVAQEELQAKVQEIERFNRLALGRETRIIELKRQANTLAVLAGFQKPYAEPDAESGGDIEQADEADEAQAADVVEINSDSLAVSLATGPFLGMMDAFWNMVGVPAAVIDLEARVLASSPWQRACTEFHRQNEVTCARCIESDTELALQLNEGQPFAMYRCKNGLTDCASPLIIDGKHVANVFVGQFFLEQPDMQFFLDQALEVGLDPAEYLAAIAEVPVVPEERLPGILSFLVGMARMMTDSHAERRLAQRAEENMTKRAEESTRERAAALSLAEDAEEARAEIEQYKGRLELLVAERTEELKTSEERFELAIRGSGDALWEFDGRTGEYWFSPRFAELLGFAEGELTNSIDTWTSLVHPDDREAAGAAFSAHLAKTVPYDIEYRMRANSGDYRWFRARARSLRDKQGRAYRTSGSISDITERKRAEGEMRQYLDDLERFNRLTLGREERMIELKEEINALLEQTGQGKKYKIVDSLETQ